MSCNSTHLSVFGNPGKGGFIGWLSAGSCQTGRAAVMGKWALTHASDSFPRRPGAFHVECHPHGWGILTLPPPTPPSSCKASGPDPPISPFGGNFVPPGPTPAHYRNDGNGDPDFNPSPHDRGNNSSTELPAPARV